MIKHDELRKEIKCREDEETRILNEHYHRACEEAFMKAVEDKADFPIRIKVSTHAIDNNKKGSSVIRKFFEDHDYRSVRLQYDTCGMIVIEIFMNGTTLARTPAFSR